MPNHPNRSQFNRSPARNPTPAEIRALRDKAGLTQVAATALLYSSLRAWEAWEGGTRRMHPAMWELFRLKVDRMKKEK